MIISSKIYKVLFVILIVGLILLGLFFNNGLRQKFYFLLHPGTFCINEGEKLSQFFNSFTNDYILKQENSFLRNENNHLISDLISLRRIKKENDDLRQALNIGLNKKFNLVLCQIQAKDISQNNILINKGLNDGLYTNLPVVNQNKVLFGWITKVYNNFSVVQLITNKKSSFGVEVLGKDLNKSIDSIANGTDSDNLKLKFVSYGEDLAVGQIVISSYLNKNLPEGLLVGKISNINKIATNPFQEVEVAPFFNISSAKNLFVITNY